jgi:N-methylhydantoinase A
VEVVNFRLTARARLYRAPPRERLQASGANPEPVEERPVWFGWDRALPTPVYERAALEAGQRLPGPAVIEQLDATTLLFPGDRLTVDDARNLIVEVKA